ncbi:MAG: hypothetical protein HZB55_22100 [Deltaproteobacteria bacterium]|nr:hypothetical protein [Deltaproteobacteria bacterium]
MVGRVIGTLGILVLLLLTRPAGAADILIVQSSRIAAFEEAVRAFEQVFGVGIAQVGPKQAQGHRLSTLVLANHGADTALARTLRARPPDLVLAVGIAALTALGTVPDLPTVYLFVPNPERFASTRRQTTGVSLDASPAASLDALLKLAPHVRRIGVVFDPAHGGPLVAEAVETTQRWGITPVTREAHNPGEVPGRLASLKGSVDALWMVPDLTVTTPEVVEAILLFALSGQLPVLTFSEKHLDLGATVSVAFDPAALGEKAAELAAKLLTGSSASEPPPPARADRFRVRVNPTTAGKLGLAMSEAPSGEVIR